MSLDWFPETGDDLKRAMWSKLGLEAWRWDWIIDISFWAYSQADKPLDASAVYFDLMTVSTDMKLLKIHKMLRCLLIQYTLSFIFLRGTVVNLLQSSFYFANNFFANKASQSVFRNINASRSSSADFRLKRFEKHENKTEKRSERKKIIDYSVARWRF